MHQAQANTKKIEGEVDVAVIEKQILLWKEKAHTNKAQIELQLLNVAASNVSKCLCHLTNDVETKGFSGCLDICSSHTFHF